MYAKDGFLAPVSSKTIHLLTTALKKKKEGGEEQKIKLAQSQGLT